MDENAMTSLCSAIIKQAADDYVWLVSHGRNWHESNADGFFSTYEIETFFRGDWCRSLLRNGMGVKIDGVTIFRHLKTNPEKRGNKMPLHH